MPNKLLKERFIFFVRKLHVTFQIHCNPDSYFCIYTVTQEYHTLDYEYKRSFPVYTRSWRNMKNTSYFRDDKVNTILRSLFVSLRLLSASDYCMVLRTSVALFTPVVERQSENPRSYEHLALSSRRIEALFVQLVASEEAVFLSAPTQLPFKKSLHSLLHVWYFVFLVVDSTGRKTGISRSESNWFRTVPKRHSLRNPRAKDESTYRWNSVF
jgi:hypothetical protein